MNNKFSIDVCAAVIFKGRKILLTKRPTGKPQAEFWEFPGGKREKNETDAQCLMREIKEELGCEIGVLDLLMETTFDYPDKRVHLYFYRCFLQIQSIDPSPCEGQEMNWCFPSQLLEYPLLPADCTIAQYLSAF